MNNKKGGKRQKQEEKEKKHSALFSFLFLFLTEITLILIIACIFCFYWYRFRPAKIISACAIKAKELAVIKNKDEHGPAEKFKSSDREQYYRWCLQEQGLQK